MSPAQGNLLKVATVQLNVPLWVKWTRHWFQAQMFNLYIHVCIIFISIQLSVWTSTKTHMNIFKSRLHFTMKVCRSSWETSQYLPLQCTWTITPNNFNTNNSLKKICNCYDSQTKISEPLFKCVINHLHSCSCMRNSTKPKRNMNWNESRQNVCMLTVMSVQYKRVEKLVAKCSLIILIKK